MECFTGSGYIPSVELRQQVCHIVELHGLLFWVGVTIMIFGVSLSERESLSEAMGITTLGLSAMLLFARFLEILWSWVLPPEYWNYYAYAYQIGPILFILIGFAIYSSNKLTGVIE